MVTKDELYSYRTFLKSMEISGSREFKQIKANKILFQVNTDKFLSIYGKFFPNECRILKTYALRIIKNTNFSPDEIGLLHYLVNIIDEDFDKVVKQPKVFISHCEKDIAIVENFVDLLSHIGLTSDLLFCSSIPGYNIKQGSGDIYEYLRNEFSNNLFVIFMLSENYYNSKPCLNEMGATWVLQKEYQSILLPGFDFSQVQGAINPREVSFKLDDKKYRTSALGELKNNIIHLLELPDIDSSKWDYQRERFFAQIDNLNSDKG